MDLAEFLLARIAEDEAVAQAATAAPWSADEGRCCVAAPEAGILAPVSVGGGGGTDDDVTHIARHDPARVLAECEAKRAIIAHLRQVAEDQGEYSGWCWFAEEPLRMLAAVYEDHADYETEWRPGIPFDHRCDQDGLVVITDGDGNADHEVCPVCGKQWSR